MSLDNEIAAYNRMRDVLEMHHRGKWVVIRDGKLVSAYDTVDTAGREAVRRFGRGPYLIRQVGAPVAPLPASVRFGVR